jgi:hypothetical protein
MDFDGPQPFNVEPNGRDRDRDLYPVRRVGRIGRRVRARQAVPNVNQEISEDRDLYPKGGDGVKGPNVPVVPQEITPDRNLYPPATPRQHKGKLG